MCCYKIYGIHYKSLRVLSINKVISPLLVGVQVVLVMGSVLVCFLLKLTFKIRVLHEKRLDVPPSKEERMLEHLHPYINMHKAFLVQMVLSPPSPPPIKTQ